MRSRSFAPDPERCLPALALGAAAAAYANALLAGFQFDDYNVIVDSARVHDWSGWWRAARSGGLRPLLGLTYTFSWVLGGGRPFAFHAFNLAVHLAATAIVFLLSGAFLRAHRPEFEWRVPASWASLLFAVHPVHTEAVTYVCGRSTSLMTLLYLAALLSYSKAAAGARGARAVSCGLFLIAVAVKESAMLLPLALLLWEWSLGTPWPLVARRQWPYWALAAFAAAALVLHPGTWSLMWQSVQVRPLQESFATQLGSAGALLLKLAWPAHLDIDPDWPRLAGIGDALPQLLLAALAVALAWRLRAARPWVSLALLWALAHLMLPNVFFPRIDVANERQLYWADWAACLAVAVEVRERLPRRAGWAAILAASLALACVTVGRNALYADPVALWEDTARHSPGKGRVFNNLGYAYERAGRPEDARKAYLRALELDPDSVKAANNLQRLRAQPDPAGRAGAP